MAGDKHYEAAIVDRRELSSDLWVIRVDPGGPFRFVAGQYATLGVQNESKKIERAYSIVSSPYEETLEFFIELEVFRNQAESGILSFLSTFLQVAVLLRFLAAIAPLRIAIAFRSR